MTRDDVITLLDGLARQTGSISAAARHLDVSDTHLGDVLAGRRPLSRKILAAIGLQAIERYEHIPQSSRPARRRTRR